jgi:hypothetical protein
LDAAREVRDKADHREQRRSEHASHFTFRGRTDQDYTNNMLANMLVDVIAGPPINQTINEFRDAYYAQKATSSHFRTDRLPCHYFYDAGIAKHHFDSDRQSKKVHDIIVFNGLKVSKLPANNSTNIITTYRATSSDVTFIDCSTVKEDHNSVVKYSKVKSNANRC